MKGLTEKLYRHTMYERTTLQRVQSFVSRWNIQKLIENHRTSITWYSNSACQASPSLGVERVNRIGLSEKVMLIFLADMKFVVPENSQHRGRVT